MTTQQIVALALVAVAVVATLVVGSLGTTVARTTDDFLAASRTVGSRANAAAISGQYVSAATFLGVAGLVMSQGADALWYPVGFVGGFLALLLFVAAPLRRSGAYTVPDFAEARLDSSALRLVTTVFVVVIGWLYLVPQLQASGLALQVVTNLPEWVGAVVVGLVVTAAVTFGGMRSMTVVQGFQFWLRFAALGVPAVVLVLSFLTGPGPTAGPAPPVFPRATAVDIETPVQLQVTAPTDLQVVGTVDGRTVNGPVRWEPGRHQAAEGTTLTFPAGTATPVLAPLPVRDDDWIRPFGSSDATLLQTYSVIVATFLGTMGLPHILVRFYSNPDGRAARRTTVLVIALLGGFALLPILLGALARTYVPQLLVNGDTDAAVMLVPLALPGGVIGTVLAAVVAAGAFAAFLTVSSGLLLTVAGALSGDLLPGRLADFRIAAHVGGVVPIAITVLAVRLDFAQTVAMALAIAASSFAPLLVLGIWWRGLTDRGAIAGMVAGGGLATAAIALRLGGVRPTGSFGALFTQPALITVPLAFLVMVLVSRATSHRVPPDVGRTLLRLHAPERLGLGQVPRAGRTPS